MSSCLFYHDIKAGDSITNLKLQKLVYFAQGVSLALNNKALEEIQAWQHSSWTIQRV